MYTLANIHNEFSFIKAAFESDAVKKMSALEKHKPTLVAKCIGMNQGRYGSKLFNPKEFSPSEIIRLSIVFNIDAGLIINVIKNELLEDEMKRINHNFERLKK